jgi:hypothetical protein
MRDLLDLLKKLCTLFISFFFGDIPPKIHPECMILLQLIPQTRVGD